MKTPVPHIVAKDVVKKVQLTGSELTILQNIDLRINQGATVAIVGASGSGKSTLLGILAGLDQASSGEVYLAGQALHQLSEDERAELRARSVGFVFQSFLLLPSLTALENVTLPAELAGMPDARARGLELLAQVGLSHRADFFPNQMSGGEQQRVAIARAFITKPAVLFADEPSANLDSATGEKIEDLLFELNEQQGTTLVLVTHNHELAQRCQFRFQMHAGHLTADLTQATEDQRHVG
ncbi:MULTISPECIES: ABC transporter ATP-binding protein [Rheinheimera]|jgi:putative ABC transport system ATP-binding protein|uniref:ABC transporter ATP-binding protein n=2 Tax=Rheinheimera TaxID=67575 RepID=A0A5C8M1N1_9GAMM|nr:MULTISPECIES: ABC transporter ATP-binding protein [Rheinheimera]KOO58034.1 ABC transporter [Rheinheimera sp. KL1]TXK81572.1 ABC transporter ATP-binding protein [Rheinheimera tangshanensis]GGM56885.1 ABC transporter ATP-binding protein [Rheinheimera tangshanensis]